MPDPLTVGLAAFAAIKKGIEIGKDLSQMSKDFGQLYDFIDEQKEIKQKGSKNDVLANYIAYEKAMDMERELTRIIQQTRGASGLRKFKQMQHTKTHMNMMAKMMREGMTQKKDTIPKNDKWCC